MGEFKFVLRFLRKSTAAPVHAGLVETTETSFGPEMAHQRASEWLRSPRISDPIGYILRVGEVPRLEAPSVERKLAAIFAADVAGYSRLMGADEEGTHERVKAHLGELVNPKIAEHRGRIVKNTGDGFLAEFASVVDAVRCAVEEQRGMAERNAEIPPKKRLEFRVGINLGDVIAEEQVQPLGEAGLCS